MREAILDKIARELRNDIDNEPKAIYLLAEIRKYIDSYGQEEKVNYPNIYFYCNWVLHIELSRTPAKEILNRFESIFSSINNLKEMAHIFIKQESNFYLFVDLKEELRIFLEANNLPTELLEDHSKWSIFKKLLVEILMDCPLVNDEERRVSKFFYEKGNDKKIQFRVKIKKLGSFKVKV